MRTLGIETAGEMGGVGVIDDARVLSDVVFEARADHGAKLTPAVDAALRLAGVTRQDVTLVAVSCGPGSFTGLRIGLAFAKGLTRALGVPLVGVPTLDAYAERARFWTGRLWVLFPDRRSSIYRATYEDGQMIEPPGAHSVDEWRPERSTGAPSGPVLMVGPGIDTHGDALRQALPEAQFGPSALARPSGAAVAQIGAVRHADRGVDGLYDLEPLYGQGPPVSSVKSDDGATA